MKIRDGTQLANTDANPANTDAEVRIQNTIIMLMSYYYGLLKSIQIF